MKMHVKRINAGWWIGSVEGERAFFAAYNYEQLHAKYRKWRKTNYNKQKSRSITP